MKILASDFDNTIYYLPEDERSIRNKSNVEAINKFVSRGNTFIIITGRNYSNLKRILNEIGLKYTYLVCDDGAKIFTNVDYCIYTMLLDRESIDKIIPVLEKENCDYYLDDGYNVTQNKDDCVKIVINCKTTEEKNRMVEIVKENNIHIYASRFYVNIINNVVNKRDALKELFELENLNYNNLYCIGDNTNDYSMLKEFRGAVIKQHNEVLDELKKEEFETIKDYIEYLNRVG